MRGWGQSRAPSQGRDRDSGPFPGAGQRQRGGPLPAEGAEAPGGRAEGAVGTDRWQREDRARAGKQSASATAWRGCADPAPSLRWDTVTSKGPRQEPRDTGAWRGRGGPQRWERRMAGWGAASGRPASWGGHPELGAEPDTRPWGSGTHWWPRNLRRAGHLPLVAEALSSNSDDGPSALTLQVPPAAKSTEVTCTFHRGPRPRLDLTPEEEDGFELEVRQVKHEQTRRAPDPQAAGVLRRQAPLKGKEKVTAPTLR